MYEVPPRDPAKMVASATLPAIPLGLLLAAIGQFWLGQPFMVWAGLIVAGGNLAALVGYAWWHRRRFGPPPPPCFPPSRGP
jgi:sterol desaturase/sphingolipid hydroxylase (fatty acid hydroxylase superfamily)